MAFPPPNRPLSRKKTIQLLLIITLLCWATQTMLRQIARGQVVTNAAASVDAADALAAPPPPAINAPAPMASWGGERFIPVASGNVISATLEFRPESTVTGGDIRLRQICRWADADNAAVAPIANLVVAHVTPQSPFLALSVDDVEHVLQMAGVNLAALRFSGPIACTVSRGDVSMDDHAALEAWADAKTTAANTTNANAAPSLVNITAPSGDATTNASPLPTATLAAAQLQPPASQLAAASADPANPASLRGVLLADLATRLHVPIDTLQVDFRAGDERLLNLSAPLFKFDVTPRHAKSLGRVSWDVLIMATGGGGHRCEIAATARAWQDQTVVIAPVGTGVAIASGDVAQRRILVDDLGDDPILTSAQAVGQAASRDLRPGMVLTSRLVQAVQLIRQGQAVTVLMNDHGIGIQAAAIAMENGICGQQIKLKNEATNDVYLGTITGAGTATVMAADVPRAAMVSAN